MTFVAISDTHLHNWSQFAIPTESGINSRLLQILKAIEEAGFEGESVWACLMTCAML